MNVSKSSTIKSVVCKFYRFDSSGRGPSNGLLLSLRVDRRRLWPAGFILGSDEGCETLFDLLNRPGLRSGSSFSRVVR